MSQHNDADPLTVLRANDLPVQPDPAFAARLRSRLESALSLPTRSEGVVMSGTDQAAAELTERSGPISGAPNRIQHGDIGYVSVWTTDPERAARFYGHLLGWTYDSATHAVTNTVEHIGIFGVADRATMFCCYVVDDLQAAREAILAGGGGLDEIREFDFGSVLGATDPLGTEFSVYQPAPDQPRPQLNGAGPGELSYVTYEVADSATFRAFYSRVLYWTFEPGHIEDGWQVVGSHPMAGVAGGSQRPATVPMWTVSDIDAAVERVREARGTVLQPPTQQPYGRMAECTDDQGGRFYLGQF
jgi:predicted enzyme related to lactoylglutathione lyase